MAEHTDIQAAARLLKDAGLVAINSGAGISKESGIPTFREAQTGLWERYDPEQLATPGAFRRNPDLVWSWYRFRYHLVSDADPNPGHYAVADMEDLFPELVVLTQNVDGLHQRAGSTDVVELHGSIRRYRCFDSCQGFPTVIRLVAGEFAEDQAPQCPHCGALIRPDVVWYGESLPRAALDRAFDVAARCDVMLVVGTSGIVQPAASLPYRARETGAAVIEVNPRPSDITPVANVHLKGPSGEVLPRLVAAVRSLRQQGE